MRTISFDFTPEMLNSYSVENEIKPSWYRGERYDYVEQVPLKNVSKKNETRFFWNRRK
ncbi:MAG: hypothetical protein LKH04_04725 [Lachnospiraceae bacterium]|jgi:hypothetical protein|nr:hypothetical protein [Lachnospiraceae bacterium]MCI1397972.1 hypothetical protein [Lachnospiraceae bacterium]MCI1423592.1 hypothetical protein [Lachnospiraceae bacterium]MCI1453707.1 hypothetical protein [Lachnospiraceae bacterium]MDD5848642.1 hypothetical protein [Bacillota bacterium]